MTQAQEVVQSLLSNVPVDELSSDEQRAVFEKIKERLISASDLNAELQSLYKVKNFSDFALCLMWIVERVEGNPLMQAASPEDETLVFSLFRRAQGEDAVAEAGGGSSTGIAGAAEVGSGDPAGFSFLIEQFTERVQSGDESRTVLLGNVLKECEAVAAGEYPQDYKEFCALASEFLNYVSENQLLDDIRVLNILANIPSPVAQWANAAPDARAGLLEEATSVLRDFKSHFE
jgi:hypothetical protein